MSVRLIIILFLSTCWSCKLQRADPTVAQDYEVIFEKIEAAINHEIVSKNLNAFSIVIVRGEELLWNRSFGYKDLAHTIPADEHTVFRVGSVSKLFTDIAIMQKVESGELDLDAPVTDYLPQLTIDNPTDVPITLRMLTSHRSGILREPRIGNYFDAENDNLEKSVLSINGSHLIYNPGEKVKYSNAGIAVVGYVLEKQSGQPYVDYMTEHVLRPIGMDNSAFELTDQLKANLAEASMWSYDGREFPAPAFQLGMAPAGSLYAPMKDLGLFMISMFKNGTGENDRYLKAETLKSMWQPQFEGTPTDGFGIGFRLTEFHGMQQVGHGGAIYGFSTQLSAVPEIKLGVACASSVDITNSITRRIADYALELMYAADKGMALPDYEVTTNIPVEKQIELAGYYKNDQRGLHIVRKKDELVMITDRSEYVLKQGKESILSDGRAHFGNVQLIENEGTIVVNGNEYQKSDQPKTSFYPEDWNKLIGEYGDDHIILYVFEKEGSLFALIEWFEIDKLTQISKNEFAFPEVGGMYHGEKLIFERGVNDEVIQVAIENGPIFKRRVLEGEGAETFQIKPVMGMAELEKLALAATPPKEKGTFKETDLVELNSLDPTIKYDIRYATTNNFMGSTFYSSAHAFLQKPAAEALVRVHQKLKSKGYGLLIHDAYRPWYVTKMFWDATPEEKKIFVANPENGSRHNRGAAVDLTLFDLKTGNVLEMVAGYDEMTDQSFPFYYGGNTEQRYHRDLLRTTMESEGFTVYDYEWWHFDYKDWQSYRIGNLRFEEL